MATEPEVPGTDLIKAGASSPYELLQMDPAEVQDLVGEALSPGETLSPKDLTRVKVPAGGVTQWTIDTMRGEETSKELVGVLLRIDSRRAYWFDEYSGGNEEPDCYSDDMIQGHANTEKGPGTVCAECPMNEFESARNGLGKACKETRTLFLLPRDSILPIVLNVPPASLSNFKAFRVKLLQNRLKPTDVEVKLTLEKAKNAGGIDYGRIIPTVTSQLDPGAAAQMKAFANLVAPAMQRIADAPITREDLGADAEAA